jgi:hypothetical protein
LNPGKISNEVSIGGADGRNKLLDFLGIFQAFVSLDARAHVNGQRPAVRSQSPHAIGHVCRCESTRQNEVSIDVWWQQ